MGIDRNRRSRTTRGRRRAIATALSTSLLGVPALLLGASPASALGAQTTWLVSRAAAASSQPSLTPDGRFVAFTSEGQLVAADTNNHADVYLASAAGATPYGGTPELLSADPAGQRAEGRSSEPAVSADGHYVAFTSEAPDLVAGPDSAGSDVYLRDTRLDTTVRVQGGSLPDGASSQPAISADGRYVVFTSSATNLVAGDTNGVRDVFRWDRETGQVTRVSTSAAGAQLAGASYDPSISGSGGAVAFTSENTGLDGTPAADAGNSYGWHRGTDADGDPVLTRIGAAGRNGTGQTALSGDGVVVAYVSRQSSYQGVTGLGTDPKVFVESLGGHWEWVSDGLPQNAAVSAPSLSADGSTVAFTAGTAVRLAETESRYGAGGAGSDGVAAPVIGPSGSGEASASATGRTVALSSTGTLPGDTDNARDVAVVGTAAVDQALHPALDSLGGLRKPAPLPFVDPSRIPAAATFVQPGTETAGGTRIGGTRIGGTRIGGTRIGGTRIGGTRIGGTRIGGTRIGGTRIGGTRIGGTRIGGTRIGDLPLTEWSLVAPGGWKVLLAGTPFDGLPLASVTLTQVQEWAAANPGDPRAQVINDLTLAHFTPDSPFGQLTVVSVLMLSKPVAEIPVPGDPNATDLANWRTAVAAQGFDPASVDGTTTLLDLDGRGVDLELTGVGSARAAVIAPADTALGFVPVDDLSLDNPLGHVRLADLPAAVRDAVVDCGGTCTGTLEDAQAAGDIRPAATLATLVPGLPAGITLDEVVRSLLDPLDFPWEGLDWDVVGAGRYNIPEDPAPGARTGLTEVGRFRAGFDTGPGGAAYVRDAVLDVQLPPGTWFHDASVAATGPLAYVTPYTPEDTNTEELGDLVRFHLGDVPSGTTVTVSVRATDATNYQQDQPLRSTLRSTTGSDDAVITLQGFAGYAELVDPPAGDDPANAPVLDTPNRIYFGGITSADDVDHVRIPRPGPGKRLVLASGTRGPQTDVGVFQLTSAEQPPANGQDRDSRGLGASPVLEDDLAGAGSGHQLPAPLNIWDVPGWSLLDSSTHTGTQEELVTVDGDSRGGDLLVRIQAADGRSSLLPYTLRYAYVDIAPEQKCPAYQPKHSSIPLLGGGLTAPVILPGTNTIFLIDQKRLAEEYGSLLALDTLSLVDAGTWVAQALADLNGQFGVKSAVIPITGLDPLDLHKTSAVVAARERLDRNPCSVSASNGLARAVDDLLATYLTTDQAWADLKNIVIVGGDDQIPFWRVPGGTFGARETDNEGALRLGADRGGSCDGSVQPELTCDRRATPLSAAAAGDFVLTDDAHGDVAPVGVLDRTLYLPDVAIGRLVETPTDVRNQVSTFLQRGGRIQADTALSTGYGAWDEVPAELVDALLARVPAAGHQKLNGAWTKADLTSRLFPSGDSPRLVSVNAHMGEDSLLPGQPGATETVPKASDLYRSSDLPANVASRLAGRLLYTIGCHAGQAMPDAWYGSGNRDWAESFNNGAYVGNTGWGVADDAATAMSERLLVEYAAQLARPGVTAGQALARAKQAYAEQLGLFMGYDEKVLMQTTYYGLPMYQLDGAGAEPPPSATTWTSGSDLGLTTRSTTLAPSFETRTGPGGSWQQANGQDPVFSPGNPIVARVTETLPTVAGVVPHGGLVTTLTSAGVSGPAAVAAENVGGRTLPERRDDIAFPSSLTSVTGQRLAVVASRVDADSTASTTSGRTERLTSIGVRGYYSSSPDHTEPFVDSSAERGGGGQTITVRARDDGGPTKAAYLLTSTGGPGTWSGQWMTPLGNDTYRATIPCGGDVRWFTQVVDGAGNVGIDMERGYFGQCSQAAPVFEVGGDAQVLENAEFVRITGSITDADSDRFTGTFDFGTGPREMEIVRGPDGAFRAVVQAAGLHAGSYQVTVTVCDDSGLCSSRTFTLTVTPANTAPEATVTLNTTSPVTDEVLVATASATDVDEDEVTLRYQWYVNGEPVEGATGTTFDLGEPGHGDEGDTVTVTVVPDDGIAEGGGSSASAIVRFNTAPTVNAGADRSLVEGSALGGSASYDDPDGDPIVSATVDYGDGSGVEQVTPSGGTIPLAHTYRDDGTHTLTVTVTDKYGATASDTATVTVTNAAPVIGPNTSPAAPVATGEPTVITVAWTDPGPLDTHTVTVSWGDGTTSAATVDPQTRTATATHTYATAGTYVIGVTVTDDDGASVTESPYDFGVVFDSTAGYLTANGYYTSPAGSWLGTDAQRASSAKAEFGLNAKFTGGSAAPTGKFRFTYDIQPEDHGCAVASCLAFDSTAFSSLVVSGSKATLKGTGTLNGVTGHTFLVTVLDGSPDKVRIRIVNKQNKVVYDTQPGAADTADPLVALLGGSVLLKKVG